MCNNLLLATISMTIILQTKVFRGKIRYTFWVWFHFIKCKRDEFIVTRPDWKYLTVTLLSSVGFFCWKGGEIYVILSCFIYDLGACTRQDWKYRLRTERSYDIGEERRSVRILGNSCGIWRWTVDNAPCSWKLSFYGSPVSVSFHRTVLYIHTNHHRRQFAEYMNIFVYLNEFVFVDYLSLFCLCM